MEQKPIGDATDLGSKAPTSFEIKVQEALDLAKVSGEWDFPLADSATDAAEMNHVDWAYWLYKKESPTIKAESGVREALFATDKSLIQLPDRFIRSTSLTMSASGDLTAMNGIEASKDTLYTKVNDVIFDADISFANLEAAVTTQDFDSCFVAPVDPENCTLLRSSPAQFAALVGHKQQTFSVLNFANNHTFDLGLDGIKTTQRLFAERNIVGIGTPATPEDYGRATFITRSDIKIGFISATFGLNNRALPENEKYRIHTAKLVSKYVEPDLELLNKQIEHCKSQNCDFIVASLHWGHEFEFFPRASQLETAHLLIEQGVDLILGHHPHVIQPVEYYRTKRDPNRIAVIAYSMGGLTWGAWDMAPHVALSLILRMKLSKGTLDDADRTYVASIDVVPVLQNVLSQDGNRFICVETLAEHVRARRSHSEEWGRRIEQIDAYARLVLGNSFS
ncbi:CapA family protein [Labrys okinawensis]|uniref:CapA family protein n=1 Tax=Labrys okinawensis TaxID=346911 RepID=UPI0039BCAD4C